MSAVGIAVGFILVSLSKRKTAGNAADFMHLTERVMLYVVFTFGEMIIAVAAYFAGNGSLDADVIYFSVCTFLIVVGLFLSYGILYDRMIDRENGGSEVLYMIIHVFIIFCINNITTALEFMREGEIEILPKIIFLVASVVGYHVFLFCTGRFAKKQFKPDRKFIIKLLILTGIFVVLMLLFRENMHLNVLMTTIYVFAIYGILLFRKNKFLRDAEEE